MVLSLRVLLSRLLQEFYDGSRIFRALGLTDDLVADSLHAEYFTNRSPGHSTIAVGLLRPTVDPMISHLQQLGCSAPYERFSIWVPAYPTP